MTHDAFERLITSKEYDFIRNNSHLGKNIMFITLGGSYAYGTNTEGSDVDVRGVTLNSKSDMLGFGNFEQIVDKNTDTTIYGFNKFIHLICACNPNTIELLGNKPEHYLFVSDSGKKLLDNKTMFLSKRVLYSFGGYAQAQLRRLQVSIARNRVTPEQKGEFILTTCNTAMRTLEDNHNIPHGLFKLVLSDNLDNNGEPIIVALPDVGYDDFKNAQVPIGDLRAYLGELSGIVKSYGSLGKRNQHAINKSDKKLNKHAMHLVRLYLMAFDILENGEINTFQESDHDFLMSIRNGEYMNEDGTYQQRFFDMVSKYDERLQKDFLDTKLPDHPDMDLVEKFVIEINQKALEV